jgi:hypothetical protein
VTVLIQNLAAPIGAGSFSRAFRTAMLTVSAYEARRRGLKIKFVRRMGAGFPRAIDLGTSGL